MSGRFATPLHILSFAISLSGIRILTPDIEQQPPLGLLPHTVLPLLPPQLSLVEIAPVGGAPVGAPITGSAKLVEAGLFVGVVQPL